MEKIKYIVKNFPEIWKHQKHDKSNVEYKSNASA